MRKFLIGIDEAGRGPLAGPVALGAVAIPRRSERRIERLFAEVKNSKALSAKQREYWYDLMRAEREAGHLNFAWAYSSNLAIDERGIVWAIRSALRRALRKLACEPGTCRVLLDGSLKAPPEYLDQETIIRGDEKLMVIAMASIVAKVRRDQLIRRLVKKYPGYGLEKHVGYGTRAHYEALKHLGLSPIHRRSFLRKFKC